MFETLFKKKAQGKSGSKNNKAKKLKGGKKATPISKSKKLAKATAATKVYVKKQSVKKPEASKAKRLVSKKSSLNTADKIKESDSQKVSSQNDSSFLKQVQAKNKDTLDVLVEQFYITPEVAEQARIHSKNHHSNAVDYLLSEGSVTHDLIGQAWAELFKVPYANLLNHPPTREQVQRIPESLAKEKKLVLFSEGDDKVLIATDNPATPGLIGRLKTLFKKSKINLAYASAEDIEATFSHYRKELNLRFVEIIKENAHIAPEIIDEILKDALSLNASDIHFEPQGKTVLVRMRIDGVLQEAGEIPKEYYENILNRIKVQAHLRIDEHATAQDGAIRHLVGDQSIDMRISISPVLDGEKVVIRVLSKYLKGLTFNDIGLSADNANTLLKVLKKPFGMILTTGPTGSGKTTTLYGALKVLNHPEVNIATIEDPVEYKIPGVNHIQVNKEAGLTFASGLRSIVRQDPDVILVGEIRDNETAEIAINAALTGHLVLSTFHANDAATAIPRMLDMGIEPFLLSSTLEAVIAQRLIRRICLSCRHRVSIKRSDLESEFGISLKEHFSRQELTLYEGKGCDNCHYTGYKGRVAIFQFISMTPEMKDLILKNPSTNEIWNLAKKQGARSLFEDGIEKIKNGMTTLKELLRIAPAS